MKTLLPVCISLLLSLPVVAQTDSSKPQKIAGFYLGGGVGNPSGTLEPDDQAVELQQNSHHLIAGYQINRIIALEMQYVKYGDGNYDLAWTNKNLDFDPVAWALSANVGYSFDSGIRPFATLGFGVTDLNLQESNNVAVISDSSASVHYGLGVDLALPSLAGVTFRLAYEADFFNIENQTPYAEQTYDAELRALYAAMLYKF